MPNSPAPGPLEFYKNRFEIQKNLTRKILKAIPSDKLDYRPYERSRFDRSNCVDNLSRTLCAC